MNADEIVESLAVSRSNVSMSLKDLQGWGLVRTVHLPGDRRDHLETLHDPWELFRIVFEERRKREFDPTHRELQACLDEAERTHAAPHIRERLAREGLEIETSPSPADFAAFIRKEIPFWAKVVRESGATAD